jgi:DNA-3-methyladenine glycosylase II
MADPAPAAGQRLIAVPPDFSLTRTCAPVAWGGNRWPNVAWRAGALTWVGWEADIVYRTARIEAPGELLIDGNADPSLDQAWADRVLGLTECCPPFTDPIVEHLRHELIGLRPYAAGSVFEGIVAAIVGQSISVASAAVTEARLCALFHPGLVLADRHLWPLPRPEQLAAADPALVRTAGVTWRRAEALVGAAQAHLAGALPDRIAARRDPAAARAALLALPLVGPWTAESTLLWGIGLADAHPTGDVALLRAARLAYADPTLTLKGLDALADHWRPARAWAARLLWTALLGEAP